MSPTSNSPTTRTPSPAVRRGAAVGSAMLIASGGLFYWVFNQALPTQATPEPEATQQAVQQAQQRAHMREQMDSFLHRDAEPIMQATLEKDRASVAKALQAVEQTFHQYASSVPAFANDLTGWGTRFKVLWRSGVETVERKDQHTWTQELINEKFAKHIVSDAKLEADMLEISKQFQYELQAHRNEMLASVQQRLSEAEFSSKLKDVSFDELKQDFQQRLDVLLHALPTQSVGVGVGSLAAGILAEEAVRNVIRVVLAQLGTRLAASAAAAGGAAGGAAAAGATGGTAVAPGVGTAIGLAGGFIVGAAVDWWMTDKFEAKVSAQCQAFLDQTKTTLLEGDNGLKSLFNNQAELSDALYRKALRASVQDLPHL